MILTLTKVDITETFNYYFFNIGKELSSHISHSNNEFAEYIETKNTLFHLKSLSTNHITTALNRRKVSKSNGPES